MADYEELVKKLRKAAYIAKMQGSNPYRFVAHYIAAADAIEELQQIEGHYEGCAKDYFKDVCYYLERVPKWISVEERLPEGADKSGAICENVWLLFDDGNVYPGWMNGTTEKVYYLDNAHDVVMKAPISRVKMWQPRPESPDHIREATKMVEPQKEET